MPGGGYASDETKYTPRHITVDLGGQNAARAGGNLSSRLVMDVVDESGEKVRGFFTKDETVNEMDDFADRMHSVELPAGLEEQASLIHQTVRDQSSGLRSFVEAIERQTGESLSYMFKIRNEPKERIPIVQRTNFDSQRREIKNALISGLHIPENVVNAVFKSKAGMDYLFNLTRNTYFAHALTNTHINYHRQKQDMNINRRNNAMSDYAGLIGQPDLTARSSAMTVVNGDEEMHGTFMVNAKGYPIEHFDDAVNGFGGSHISITPAAVRQLSDLQVLDFLCANVDRNMGNMFYLVDDSDKNDIKITGVQGIDNDASFGTFDGKAIPKNNNDKLTIFGHMSLIDDIKYISESTADKIMALTKEDVENKIRLAGLSAEEIDAAGARLKLMQDKIKLGRSGVKGVKGITILKNDEDWAKLSDFHSLDSVLGAQAGRENRNIFKTVAIEIDLHNDEVPQKREDAAGKEKTGPVTNIQGAVPTAKAINIRESHALDDHIEYLEHLRESISPKDGNSVSVVPDSVKTFDKKIISVLNKLRTVNDHLNSRENENRTLSDVQRQVISEDITELNRAAAAYAEQNADSTVLAVRQCVNAAKNIKVYTEFAQDAVRIDAEQREKAIAVAEWEKMRQLRSNNVAETPHTFQNLSDRLPGLKGSSTHFKEELVPAFRELGSFDEALSPKAKIKKCEKLIKAAQSYLDYKVPNEEAEKKFNRLEKGRVRFARDLQKYAEAHIVQAKRQIEIQTEERSNYYVMANFHEECRKAVTGFRDANGEAAKEAAARAICGKRDSFVKGINTIFNISDMYTPDHDMQAACGVFLSSITNEFLKTYRDCSNLVNHTNETDVYKAIGLDPAFADKIKARIENGTRVQNKAAANNAQNTQQRGQNTLINSNANPQINPQMPH